MEDYVESNRFIVLVNATPEIKRVIISLVSLGIFIFNLIHSVCFYLIIQTISLPFFMYFLLIVIMFIEAVESTCEFYLYFASIFTKNVPMKIIYRDLDIYRIKLLPEYMDEVLCALSILGSIYGIYYYVVIS